MAGLQLISPMVSSLCVSKQRACAQARGRGGRFAASVAAADDDVPMKSRALRTHVLGFHIGRALRRHGDALTPINPHSGGMRLVRRKLAETKAEAIEPGPYTRWFEDWADALSTCASMGTGLPPSRIGNG